jgi:membrane-associated phospholipid phosphatase
MDPIFTWSLELTRALQAAMPWLAGSMRLASSLGAEEFYLIALPVMFWCISRSLGVELVVLLLATQGLNGLLKGLFKLPRPFWADPRLALSTEPTFAFPSGHSQNSAVLFGYLTVILRSPWRWVALLLILLISASRVYLGVHSVADVLVGWLLGLMVLGSYLWLKPRLTPVFRRWSLARHVLAAVVVSAISLVLYLLAAAIPNGQPATYAALHTAALAQIYEHAGTFVGIVAGAWIGLAAEQRLVRFRSDGPLQQRALRLIIGLLVVLALRFGLKAIFPEDPQFVGLAFRALRYGIIMLWVALGWPWLFVRLGWAQQEAPPTADR